MLFGEALADFTAMMTEIRLGSQFNIITAMQARKHSVQGSLHILLPYRGRDLADVDYRTSTWLPATP